MTVAPLLFAVLLQQPAAPPAPQAPARVPPSVGDTSPFRRLELPAPNLIREGSGMPGPRYWQQRADYTIQVSLDTAAHTAGGRETIRYTNNSPDTLRYAWLQVDQNIYREDSRGGAINPADARWAARGFQGGYAITAFDAVRSAATRGQAGIRRSLMTTVNGTVLRADLDRPLPPGGTATWDVAFSFQIPEHGSDRMGRSQYGGRWLYEIAQWFPRLAAPPPGRSPSRFRSPSTAPTAWVASNTAAAGCMRSRSGTRAWRSTTTSAAGTPSNTSGRASSTSSTATSTSR